MRKCPECSRDVSDQATTCPQCGYPIKSAIRTMEKSLLVSRDKIAAASPLIGSLSKSVMRHAAKIGLLCLTVLLLSVPYMILIEVTKRDLNSRIFANLFIPFISWLPFAFVFRWLYGSGVLKPLAIIFAVLAGVGVFAELGILREASAFGPVAAHTWIGSIGAKVVSNVVVFWEIFPSNTRTADRTPTRTPSPDSL